MVKDSSITITLISKPRSLVPTPWEPSGGTRGFEFYGGVPEIVPDNLKAGVKSPCSYHDMAKHYQVAVIPARVRKPKDKAKVEASVQVVERLILAVLRKRTFFSDKLALPLPLPLPLPLDADEADKNKDNEQLPTPLIHDNIRGSYYKQEVGTC